MSYTTVIPPLLQAILYNQSKKKTLKISESVDARHPAKDNPASAHYTMEALEECLRTNPKPLQNYASKKDFTIENINFLIKIPEFRQKWELIFNSCITTPDGRRRRMFQKAVKVYTTFVNPETAKLQINVSSVIHGQLKELFGQASRAIAIRRSDTRHQPISEVAPWVIAAESQPKAESQLKRFFGKATVKAFGGANAKFHRFIKLTPLMDRSSNDPLADIDIPSEFDQHCFDAAEMSIKELVYSTTWQEFNKRNSNPAV